MDNQNRYIENLYTEEIISAEVYLFCLDHDIETIDDIKTFIESNRYEIPNDDLFGSLLSLCQSTQNNIEASKSEESESIVCNNDTMGVGLSYYVKLYHHFKENYSNRTKNVLNRLEIDYDFPSNEFFDFLLYNESPLYAFKKLRNSGAKTVEELISLSEDIINNIDAVRKASDEQLVMDQELIIDNVLDLSVNHCELLDTALRKELLNISVRSRNAIEKIRSERRDFNEFYRIISSPDFDIIGLKNVGRGCVSDFHQVINCLSETIVKLQSESNSDLTRLLLLESRFGLSEKQAQIIDSTVSRDIEFPIFAIIKLLIDDNERMRVISNRLINIYDNQVIAERDDVGELLGISAERVRQLRNMYLEQILGWLQNWGAQYSSIWSQYEKSYLIDYEDSSVENVNKSEGVNFNSNFIYTSLHLLKKADTAIIGDYVQAFLTKTDKEYKLHIVPQVLNAAFDFDTLLNDLRSRIHEKVYETYIVNIKEYILSFFRGSIAFDIIPEIVDVCRKLIYKNFGIIVQDDTFSIEQNAIKNIPDILEDIMRANNRIMTLDELYQEIENSHPGITKDRNSLRGSILRNPNILAVSRSSSYTLKEWNNTELRGGTIRDISFDFLDMFDYPQSIESIAEYVLTFRPNSNPDSVYANLFSDQTKRFSQYENNGRKTIGLSHKEYPSEFQLVTVNETTRRKSFDESMDDFELFILENNRYPFSSGVNEEEERLNRFLGVQNAKLKKGELSEEEKIRLLELESKYGHLRISKRDYLWNLKYAELEQFSISANRLPKRTTELELYSWFYDQTRGNLNEEQQAKITDIKSRFEYV